MRKFADKEHTDKQTFQKLKSTLSSMDPLRIHEGVGQYIVYMKRMGWPTASLLHTQCQRLGDSGLTIGQLSIHHRLSLSPPKEQLGGLVQTQIQKIYEISRRTLIELKLLSKLISLSIDYLFSLKELFLNSWIDMIYSFITIQYEFCCFLCPVF